MISTHILDLKEGLPAEDVSVSLELKTEEAWMLVQTARTNNDGRIAFDCDAAVGVYRLTFETEDYLRQKGIEPFFVSTPVSFHITDNSRKYHIPLLLSPYGYSTYRGS